MNDNQLDLFQSEFKRNYPQLEKASTDLPDLPNIARYYSDFYQKSFSISDMKSTDIWPFEAPESEVKTVRFSEFSPLSKGFIKAWFIWALGRISPVTIHGYQLDFKKISHELDALLEELIPSPFAAKSYWEGFLVGRKYPTDTYCALKSLLSFCCDYSIGGWTHEHANFLSSFPLPSRTRKYLSLRNGSAYLSSNQQAQIVTYFDAVAHKVQSSPNEISNRRLRSICMLYWSFSHGVRPIQIANRQTTDLTVWHSADGGNAVHLRFQYAKQRSRGRDAVQTRSMKREWGPIMLEYLKRRYASPSDFITDQKLPNSLFGLRPKAVSRDIKATLHAITGDDLKPYDLRHTAAQRNVDAGMSALELAEFLMHADIDTGRAYYDTSATQAELVNRALGLSPIYRELAETIRSGTINKAKLVGLPPDNQVGAAPHGYPVVGIGACTIGQKVCNKNPALSCYSCSKFLALSDTNIHLQVRDTFQEIVREFTATEGGSLGQPAFTQLRTALEGVNAVIHDLSKPSESDPA